MTAVQLPAELQAALANATDRIPRDILAARARAISEGYRSGGTSRPISSRDDALAYAAVRMPATFAAVSAVLAAMRAVRPRLAPQRLIDLGAGPGTASWAAAEAFPSLGEFRSIDANPALRTLAHELASSNPRLAGQHYDLGDIRTRLIALPPADLVIASYVLGEVADYDRVPTIAAMWASAHDTLVIIEPGTPDGFARIVTARAQLIADGAHVVAPCPHDHACPMAPPDWCHFSQRLPRSRLHKEVKDVAVPFEDERFSYVVLARAPADRPAARILAAPRITKAAITAKLCTRSGLDIVAIARRDKAAYARFRRLGWGDAIADDAIADSVTSALE